VTVLARAVFVMANGLVIRFDLFTMEDRLPVDQVFANWVSVGNYLASIFPGWGDRGHFTLYDPATTRPGDDPLNATSVRCKRAMRAKAVWTTVVVTATPWARGWSNHVVPGAYVRSDGESGRRLAARCRRCCESSYAGRAVAVNEQ